mmetsp:Transcript_60987/g.137922  ORF Transcript_60987/g.137922 Transcript_60987/m.137922 type:complete len:376 (+) Transcript_60987:64-1191(+)
MSHIRGPTRSGACESGSREAQDDWLSDQAPSNQPTVIGDDGLFTGNQECDYGGRRWLFVVDQIACLVVCSLLGGVLAGMECARLVLRPVAWLLGLALGGKKRDKIDADAAEHDATDTRPPHDPAFNPDCVVLFDGHCAMCHGLTRFISGRLPPGNLAGIRFGTTTPNSKRPSSSFSQSELLSVCRDVLRPSGRLVSIPLQSPRGGWSDEVQPLLKDLKLDESDLLARIHVIHAGTVFKGADGILKIAAFLQWPYPLLALFGKLVPHRFRDTLYMVTPALPSSRAHFSPILFFLYFNCAPRSSRGIGIAGSVLGGSIRSLERFFGFGGRPGGKFLGHTEATSTWSSCTECATSRWRFLSTCRTGATLWSSSNCMRP